MQMSAALCVNAGANPCVSGYRPTTAGNPGAVVLSPTSPLGMAPVPMIPGVDVFGTPG